MKLLITAFEPFGGERVNPSQLALRAMPDRVGGIEIAKLEVPVTFSGSVPAVIAAMEREKPDAVLCLGQAGGRADLTPERVAINLDDARIPDNEGAMPSDVPIASDGPAAYFATLPVKDMVHAMRKEGVSASISLSAGTFVCNHLMYGVLHHIAKTNLNVRAGFMHMPFLPEQVNDRPETPCMPLETILAGILAAVSALEIH